MPQLYIFTVALLAIIIIVSRRNIIFKRGEKKDFKEKIATKVEENRKIEQVESKTRFKDELAKEQKDKKFDLTRYKDEMRSADMAIARQQWNDAKKYLIQAISFAKDELQASLKLAKVYLESGDIRKAESLYRRLLEIAPDSPDIHESIGKILVKKRRYKEAIEAYSRALELDEKDDNKLIALGRLYHLLMHYSYAAECFRRAAELKPREVDYLFNLADSCKADDDYENALFTYEKILTVEPYNDKAKNHAHDVRLKIKENETFFETVKTN
ncbi:tetratricopeptide repeat protein [Patescibacteria group bacterium]|nr:tetratricopeptide repeat protein [Patescibacteria group bacterium]